MMNNKVTRIIANSVGLAAVAALGITVYQLGTSPVKEKTPEEKTENVGESTQDTEEQLSEDAGTNHVESEISGYPMTGKIWMIQRLHSKNKECMGKQLRILWIIMNQIILQMWIRLTML